MRIEQDSITIPYRQRQQKDAQANTIIVRIKQHKERQAEVAEQSEWKLPSIQEKSGFSVLLSRNTNHLGSRESYPNLQTTATSHGMSSTTLSTQLKNVKQRTLNMRQVLKGFKKLKSPMHEPLPIQLLVPDTLEAAKFSLLFRKVSSLKDLRIEEKKQRLIHRKEHAHEKDMMMIQTNMNSQMKGSKSLAQLKQPKQEIVEKRVKELMKSLERKRKHRKKSPQYFSTQDTQKSSVSLQSPIKQEVKVSVDTTMAEWDTVIRLQNHKNRQALLGIQQPNLTYENQLQVRIASDKEVLNTQFQQMNDSGTQLLDIQLMYNSPLEDIKRESKKFNEQIKAIQYELDYKLNVVTEKQVEQSIKETRERVENEIQSKIKAQEEKINEKAFKKAMTMQQITQKNRKMQDLIHMINKYLKEKKESKKQETQKVKPTLMGTRRTLISKWDGSIDFKRLKNIAKSNSRLSMKAIVSPPNSKKPKDFILINRMKDEQLNRQVFSQFGPAVEINIPQLELKTGFSRAEIIQIHSKFKALCEMTKKELLESGKDMDTCKGVNFQKFKLAVPELKFETEKFAQRVFNQCNNNDNSFFLDWEHFLLAVRAIQAKNIDNKIDLFFKIIDEDGNGRLSYDEVYEICASSFEKFTPNLQGDECMRGLTEFFTSIIFRAVGKELDEEIPLWEIKQAIDNKLPDSQILCMFCNADKIKRKGDYESDDEHKL